jgi:hypothetical protein
MTPGALESIIMGLPAAGIAYAAWKGATAG